MEDFLVNIIVPVSNVKKYLTKCVESLIHQTYKNVEIILVNGGLPDRCGQLIDEFLNKDKRVVGIHKKRWGLIRKKYGGGGRQRRLCNVC